MIDIYPLVYVEWQDAEHDGSWSDPRDEVTHEAITCASIGWLVHANKERLILSATICASNEQIANKQYIPRKMVIRYKVWKRGRRRDKR